jgi:Transposase, Mutator family
MQIGLLAAGIGSIYPLKHLGTGVLLILLTLFNAVMNLRQEGQAAASVDALTAHLLFPAGHWKRIRHSNLIELTFGETRRRVKVVGRQPGEQSCLSLVWAVLGRASRGWRGLTLTPKALRRSQDLRRELLTPPRHPETPTEKNVPAAA